MVRQGASLARLAAVASSRVHARGWVAGLARSAAVNARMTAALQAQ